MYGFKLVMVFFIHNFVLLIYHLNFVGKIVNTTFVVVPTSNQFQFKLGFPWLNSMHVFTSPIHKCLNFFYDEKLKMVNHSLYHPFMPKVMLPMISFSLHYLIYFLLNLIVFSSHTKPISIIRFSS